MATPLTIEQIYAVAREAGFSPQEAVTWTAIAMAESGGNPGSLNSHGEYSVGLWQINEAADRGRATRYGDLHDPLANARAAFDLSHHGLDMRPWTTTHDSNRGTGHDYRHYLPTVEELTKVHPLADRADPRRAGTVGRSRPAAGDGSAAAGRAARSRPPGRGRGTC